MVHVYLDVSKLETILYLIKIYFVYSFLPLPVNEKLTYDISLLCTMNLEICLRNMGKLPNVIENLCM